MLRSTKGGEAVRGGLDLTIALTPDQAAALGPAAWDLAEWIDTAMVGLAAMRAGSDPTIVVPRVSAGGRPVAGSVKDRPATMGQEWDEWLVRDVSALLVRLEGIRDAAIRQHSEHGGSYGMLAAAMAVPRATAQRRRDDRLSAPPTPAQMWATGTRADVRHPGAQVMLSDWSLSWPGYTPVDITPDELTPAGLPASVAEGWAEPYATPSDVSVDQWLERKAAALVPFDFDDRWWPLNPYGRTGRTGRNLGRWGENQAADGIVVTGYGPMRQILLIERDDEGGGRGRWAIPGGMVEPGETARETAPRELAEETGIDVSGLDAVAVFCDRVADWRETDHAWVVSTGLLYEVPTEIPTIAGDDALRSRWFSFGSLDALRAELESAGGLYAGHVPILQSAMVHLLKMDHARATLGALIEAGDRYDGDAGVAAIEELRSVHGDEAADRLTDGLMLAGLGNLVRQATDSSDPAMREAAVAFLTRHFGPDTDPTEAGPGGSAANQ